MTTTSTAPRLSWPARMPAAARAALGLLARIQHGSLTLVLPDGSVMSESAAILIHLGLTHPASGLLPDDPAARAQSLRGLVYIPANCYAAISVIDYPERWVADPDAATNERIRRGTRARLHEHWTIFAGQFTSHVGAAPRPSALDLLAAVVSRWSGARAHLQKNHPELHGKLVRIDAHPDVAAVFIAHWPPA